MVALFGFFLWIIFLIVYVRAKDNVSTKAEYFISFFFFLFFSLYFAHRTNLLYCGYHFTDDHEIYRIHSDIQKNGFFNTVCIWLQNDFRIRFRPTYYLIRILETAIAGNNFFLWHTIQALAIGVDTFLLYILARKMNCHYTLSVIFAFIVLYGEQSPIIWRLGPQEGWGLMLLTLSYICVINYHNNTNAKNKALLLGCSILLAGIKESFLLLIPSEILLLIYLEWVSDNISFSKDSIYRFLRRYRMFLISNIFLTCLGIVIIIAFIGTTPIGYAGIDLAYSIRDYFTAIATIISTNFAPFGKAIVNMILLCVLPFSVLCYFYDKGNFKKQIFTLILDVLFLLYILGVQFILYTKSGMYERYLIPAVFGVYLFIIVLLYDWLKRANIPNQYRSIYFVMIGLITFTVLKGSDIEDIAQSYVTDGYNTTELMQIINDISDSSESNILICMDFESDFSASVYLHHQYNLFNVYNVYYSNNNDGKYHKAYPGSETDNGIEWDNVAILVGYHNDLEDLLAEHGLLPEDLEYIEVGRYGIYKK